MDYLHYNVLLLTIAGLYKIETESTIKKMLFNLWKVLVNFIIFYLCFSSLIDILTKGYREFNHEVMNYIYLSGCLCFWLRVTYLVTHDDMSSKMVKEMRSLFRYKTDTGVEEKDLGKYISFTNKFTFAFVSYGAIVGQSFVLIPLILSSKRILSLPLWFPFEWKTSPYYEMTVFLQMFMQQVLANAVVAADAFFVCSVVLLGAQFRLLGWEIKHVLHKTLLRNGADLDAVLMYTSGMSELRDSPLEDTAEFRAQLSRNLAELIKFHQSLVYLCTRIDDFFSPMYLIYFVILVATAVFTEYSLILTKDIVLMIPFILYTFSIALTLFLPCYLGNFLTTQAEEFVSDLYDSPWYLCDQNFKTCIKMLHQSSCRPIQLTIGKFGFLSLSTYVGFVKASVSYLAVLRQMTNDR